MAKQSQVQTADQNELKLSQAKTALANAKQQLADDQAAGPADGDDQGRSGGDRPGPAAARHAQPPDLRGASTDSLTSQQNQLKLSQAQATLTNAQQKLRDRQRGQSGSGLERARGRPGGDQPGAAGARHAQPPDPGRERAVVDLEPAEPAEAGPGARPRWPRRSSSSPTTRRPGHPSTTIKADQSAIDQAQQQLDTLELSIASSGTSAANQLTSAQLSLSSSQHNYSTKVAPADASTIATDKASVSLGHGPRSTTPRTRSTGSDPGQPVDGVVTAVES